MKFQDPQKLKALHRAVLVLTERDGLRGITVPAIAREAGIAVGTFYVYFKGKEALLKDLYLKTKAESGSEILRNLDSSAPFKTSFKCLCGNYFRYRISHYVESVFQEQYYSSTLPDMETREFSRSIIDPVLELIIRGQKEELVKPLEPSLLLRFIVGTLRETAYYYGSLAGPVQDSWVESAAQLCLDGVSV